MAALALGASEGGESDLARTLSLPLANVAALVEENLALRCVSSSPLVLQCLCVA